MKHGPLMAPRILLPFGFLLLATAFSGCIVSNDPLSLTDTDPPLETPTPELLFSKPLYLNERVSGSEPAIEVAPDGTIYVSKHVTSPASRVWKSTDGGQTFSDVSPQPLGQNRAFLLTGDGDLSVDDKNTLYYSDLYVGSATLYRSTDQGKTWQYNYVASPVPVIDRQWVDAYGDGQVFLSGDQIPVGAWTSYSGDGGKTFTPGTRAAQPDEIMWEWRPVVDHAKGWLYVPYQVHDPSGFLSDDAPAAEYGVALTKDHAKSWARRPYQLADPSARLGQNTPLAVDQKGTLYLVTVEGKNGDYSVYVRHSTTEGSTWSPPLKLAAPSGSKVFPWADARAPGHLAVAYFGTEANGRPDDAKGRWDLHVFDLTDADTPNPTIRHGLANPKPVKEGVICTGGATCRGDRELGDFFELEIGPDEALHLAWGENRGAGASPASTTVYARSLL